MKTASLVLVVALASCSKKDAPPVPTTPSIDASVPPASASAPAPSPTPAQTGAAGPRNTRATDFLSKCQIPTPVGKCSTDADCTEVAITDNECCPATLHVGVSLSEAKTFSAACKAPGCPGPRPSCLVHWNYAETGDQTAGSRTIVAHCTSGVCLTSYGATK